MCAYALVWKGLLRGTEDGTGRSSHVGLAGSWVKVGCQNHRFVGREQRQSSGLMHACQGMPQRYLGGSTHVLGPRLCYSTSCRSKTFSFKAAVAASFFSGRSQGPPARYQGCEGGCFLSNNLLWCCNERRFQLTCAAASVSEDLRLVYRHTSTCLSFSRPSELPQLLP